MRKASARSSFSAIPKPHAIPRWARYEKLLCMSTSTFREKQRRGGRRRSRERNEVVQTTLQLCSRIIAGGHHTYKTDTLVSAVSYLSFKLAPRKAVRGVTLLTKFKRSSPLIQLLASPYCISHVKVAIARSRLRVHDLEPLTLFCLGTTPSKQDWLPVVAGHKCRGSHLELAKDHKNDYCRKLGRQITLFKSRKDHPQSKVFKVLRGNYC